MRSPAEIARSHDKDSSSTSSSAVKKRLLNRFSLMTSEAEVMKLKLSAHSQAAMSAMAGRTNRRRPRPYTIAMSDVDASTLTMATHKKDRLTSIQSAMKLE